MTARSKVADTDAQIQALRHHMFDECVAIASSIDTIPRALVPRAMRARWLRELRQATRAVALVKGRLVAKTPAKGRVKPGARSPKDPMIAAIDATVRPRSASPTSRGCWSRRIH